MIWNSSFILCLRSNWNFYYDSTFWWWGIFSRILLYWKFNDHGEICFKHFLMISPWETILIWKMFILFSVKQRRRRKNFFIENLLFSTNSRASIRSVYCLTNNKNTRIKHFYFLLMFSIFFNNNEILFLRRFSFISFRF